MSPVLNQTREIISIKSYSLFIAAVSFLTAVSHAEIKTVTERNQSADATAKFKFKNVPAPSRTDAATTAKFTLVDGARDNNGGTLDRLHDGKVSTSEDQPAGSFFFRAGTDGGRLQVDLGSVIEVKQVNTYSWHGATRGPQVYKLYASEGKLEDFKTEPKRGTEPEKSGWKLLATVDTRPKEGEPGGQYGVSVSDSEGAIGKYRYLLFDITRTEEADGFGNTFYSEFDVIDRNAPAVAEPAEAPVAKKSFQTEDGKYQFSIETTAAPDLTEWADKDLSPVVTEWYPKLVAMLPSEGYEAPKRVAIIFKEGMGGTPAYASDNAISCNIEWFRSNLKGEARGSVVHEMVHVVQQYGRARRAANSIRVPGWLSEGIPDYIRFFKYEPEIHGAEINRRNIAGAKYDASYRVTGNFLNWVTEKYDTNLVQKLNAAAREGSYNEELWQKSTGHTVQELGDEWKKAMQAKLGVPITVAAANTAGAAAPAAEPKSNTLTEEETKAGWKLLFDGKTLDGWHNFKSDKIRPGWQLTNGTLACIDPHNAGDLCTKDQYDWFELQLDYNISEGGNSGIIYHVTEKGGAVWATGPEIQLEDNAKAGDPQRCGWLYALYQPPIDPKTSKPLDATKPAGEWNHVRVLISPEKCEHEINGVKYFEYVLGSDDFKQRVAKSKFGSMPIFAKSDIGFLALQGDHGQVTFRNIKIRAIEVKK